MLIQEMSLDIYSKKIVSVIWYNWSWKSTLLKLLLWILSPTAWDIIRKPWMKMWYVPQKLSLVENIPLTVQDFLNIYNNEISKKTDITCNLLDIELLRDKLMSGLSWGELQKVLIYNALIGNPDMLLLDEPTSWLDVVAQKEFYALIDHLHKEHNMTIVIVSHDIHTVYSKSDTVICIHKGICCTGSPWNIGFSDQMTNLFDGYVVPYLHTHTQHDR